MLQKNKRFQTDIKKYKEIIENLENNQKKLEAQKLLNDLIYEVKNIDNMFVDMVYGKQLPTLGKEFKDKVLEIRKKLDTLLK